jgi:hypothetical protein
VVAFITCRKRVFGQVRHHERNGRIGNEHRTS